MPKLHDRVRSMALPIEASLKAKLHRDGWVLPKQTTSYAPEGTWTNVDLDVTPLERRIWTPLSFIGYWISDVVSSCVCTLAGSEWSVANMQLKAQCSVLADRCLYPCHRLDIPRSCLLHHPGLDRHGWRNCFQRCSWCLPSCSLPNMESVCFWLPRSQIPSHLPYGNCAVLAFYTDVHWIVGYDGHAHSYLAELCSHSQSSAKERRHNNFRPLESPALLEFPAPFPAHQTAQTKTVLCTQSIPHHHRSCWYNHRGL